MTSSILATSANIASISAWTAGSLTPCVGLEDDLTGLRRSAAVVELRLDEREPIGRLEAVEREVLPVRVPDGSGDAVAEHEDHDPEHHHHAAAVMAPASESCEHSGVSFWGIRCTPDEPDVTEIIGPPAACPLERSPYGTV